MFPQFQVKLFSFPHFEPEKLRSSCLIFGPILRLNPQQLPYTIAVPRKKTRLNLGLCSIQEQRQYRKYRQAVQIFTYFSRMQIEKLPYLQNQRIQWTVFRPVTFVYVVLKLKFFKKIKKKALALFDMEATIKIATTKKTFYYHYIQRLE